MVVHMFDIDSFQTRLGTQTDGAKKKKQDFVAVMSEMGEIAKLAYKRGTELGVV